MTNSENALPAPPPPPAADSGRNAHYKKPGLAAFLSAMPGMGNVYNGLYLRGVLFFLIIASLIALTNRGYELFGFAIAFFWIFNIIDAYRQATLINYGYAQDLGITDLPEAPKAGQGGLLAGVVLFFIGLFGVLEMYFPAIDLDWIIDLWPFGLMVLGGWVAWKAFQERQEAKEGPNSAE